MEQKLESFSFVCKECKNNKYWMVTPLGSKFMKMKCKFCGVEQ